MQVVANDDSHHSCALARAWIWLDAILRAMRGQHPGHASFSSCHYPRQRGAEGPIRLRKSVWSWPFLSRCTMRGWQQWQCLPQREHAITSGKEPGWRDSSEVSIIASLLIRGRLAHCAGPATVGSVV